MNYGLNKWGITLVFSLSVMASTSAGSATEILMPARVPIIERVKLIKAETSPDRTQHSNDLRDYVKLYRFEISQVDIDAITSLLYDYDDYIRASAAASLAYIGPQASSAVPVLIMALQREECEEVLGGWNSVGAILDALEKIGARAPKVSYCGGAKPPKSVFDNGNYVNKYIRP